MTTERDPQTKLYLSRAVETLFAMCSAQRQGGFKAVSWDTFIANLRLYADGMEAEIAPRQPAAKPPATHYAACVRCGVDLDDENGPGPLCAHCECDERNQKRRAAAKPDSIICPQCWRDTEKRICGSAGSISASNGTAPAKPRCIWKPLPIRAGPALDNSYRVGCTGGETVFPPNSFCPYCGLPCGVEGKPACEPVDPPAVLPPLICPQCWRDSYKCVCAGHGSAPPAPKPADTREYPLAFDERGMPYFLPLPTGGNPIYPFMGPWYGHDGYTLAWFRYADGSARDDWRPVGHFCGAPCVEYATHIVFKRRMP